MLNEANCFRPRQNIEVEAEAKFEKAEQNNVLIEYLTYRFNRCV